MQLQQTPESQFADRIANRLKNKARIPGDVLGRLRWLGITPWQDIPDYEGPDKLTEIADFVLAERVPNRFTVVESGNGLGKSVTAAALVCMWLLQGDPAAVVTLAPTHSQVNNVLWRYVRSMFQKANGLLPGDVYETPRWNISPTHYAIGLSPRRATNEDLQALYGYHNPRLLVILDEGPGLPRLLWEAIQRLVTAPGNRVLALGNPIAQAGPFWEACQSKSWNYVHMSCLDHPNVLLDKEVIPGATGRQWVEERIRDHCRRAAKDEPGAFEWPRKSGNWYQPNGVFQSMVLGQAPTEAIDQLIPLSWVTGSMEWVSQPAEDESTVIALDPSRATHGDMTAMVCRKGPLVKWVRRKRMKSRNPTDETAGWLLSEYRREGAARVFIDASGIGAGVYDKARSLGIPAIKVTPGGGADKRNAFANKRAECWWRLREALEQGVLSLPQDDLLSGDLTAPKYHHDGLGRILIESKETIRDRLGRSPDTGDALAYSFAIPAQARVTNLGEAYQGLSAPSRWVNEKAVTGDKPKATQLVGGSRWVVGSNRKRGRF